MPTNYETTTEVLMTADAAARNNARATLEAALVWAAYVKSARVNVTEYFDRLAKDRSVTLFRAASTWKKDTSHATTVLSHWTMIVPEVPEGDAPVPVHEDPVTRAMIALDAFNDDRVSAGRREMWSLQNLAKDITAPKADKAKAETSDADASDTADAGKSQLDVVLAAIAHLSAEELAVAADAIAQRQTLTAVA